MARGELLGNETMTIGVSGCSGGDGGPAACPGDLAREASTPLARLRAEKGALILPFSPQRNTSHASQKDGSQDSDQATCVLLSFPSHHIARHTH